MSRLSFLSRPRLCRTGLPGAFLIVGLLAPPQARADISGTVVDGSNTPIAGVRIHLQADPNAPVVITGPTGAFTVALADPGIFWIAASIPYDASAAVNYNTNANPFTNPSVGNLIVLDAIPAADNPAYAVPTVNQSCSFCHSQYADEWQFSVHASAGTDFWVRDLFSGDGSPGGSAGYVYTASHDPGETGTCATCHTVLADAFNPGQVMLNQVTDAAALEGVSCLACHQIHTADGDVNAIFTLGNADFRFPDDGLAPTNRYVWGPLDDVENNFMRASHAPVYSTSRYCASCHNYQEPFGQSTFTEWQASPFAVPGPGFRSCQDCHMPERADDGTICDLGDPPIRPASQRHQHEFIGSTPATLAANLGLTSTVAQDGRRIRVHAAVSNFGAGHDFPTGISIRNAFLLIEASVNGQPLPQASGPTIPFWADDDVPGKQPGDWAGSAGKGFAKINQGRINGQGPPVAPVLFVDAETVIEHSNIPSGATDVTDVEFDLPAFVQNGDTVEVTARLIYRRAFRALAVTKGWTQTPQGGPIEIEVANTQANLEVQGTTLDIPALGHVGLGLLAALLALVGWILLRR